MKYYLRAQSKVMGIDPGGVTGWSTRLDYGELPKQKFLLMLKDELSVGNIDRVVIERFDMRSITADAVATVELIGAIKWLVFEHHVPIGQVTASAKKKTSPMVSDRLMAHGAGHAADAEAVRLWDLEYGKWYTWPPTTG